MVDKLKSNTYVWYSGATDVTGKNLADRLGIKAHGASKPVLKDSSLIICWGTKVKNTVFNDPGETIILNHPNSISKNRNKLESLQIMDKSGVNIPKFTTDISKVKSPDTKPKKDDLVLPVICRSSYHQGGKGFWSCPTLSQVKSAFENGASYIQEFVDIKEEYRLHVFMGNVIYATKKVKKTKEEMEQSFIEHELNRQADLARKNGNDFDEAIVRNVLRRQAKSFIQDGSNPLIRSNRLGWKFSRVQKYNKDLATQAIKAISGLNLDFGAVDCCVDQNDNAWIIEVNTGPGLEGSSFDAWSQSFEDFIKELTTKNKKQSKTTNTKKQTSTSSKTANEKEPVTKQALSERIKLMQDMVNATEDESEAQTLNKVFSKLFE